MKFSKWLQMMLFGIGLMQFSVDGSEGGGSGDGGTDGGTGDGGTGDSDDGDSGTNGGTGASGTDGGAGGNEGNTKISDSEAKLLKEVMDKKNALKKEREDRAALEAKLKQFEGIDPEQVRTLIQEKREAETKKLEEKGQWESLKKQMAEEHGKEKSTLLEQLTDKDSKLAAAMGTIAELTVGNAFAQSAFIRDELSLTTNKTRVVYGGHFDYMDGQIVGYDKPAGAKDRAVLVDASGEPLQFEAALRKLVEADPDKDQLLKSKMKTGAGSKTVSGTKTADTKTQENVAGVSRIASALSKAGIGGK